MIRYRFVGATDEGLTSTDSRLRAGPGLYIAATVALTALLSLPVIRPLLPRLVPGRDVGVAGEVALGVIPWALSFPGVRTDHANGAAIGRVAGEGTSSGRAPIEVRLVATPQTAERLGQIMQPEEQSDGGNRDRRSEPRRGHEGDGDHQPESRTPPSVSDGSTAPDNPGEGLVGGGSDGPSGGDAPAEGYDGPHHGHEGDNREGHGPGGSGGRGDRDRGGDYDGPRRDRGGDDDGPRRDRGGDDDGPRRDRGGDDDGPRSNGPARGNHGSDGRTTTRGGGHRGRRIRSSR
jgi:hypothetical protein